MWSGNGKLVCKLNSNRLINLLIGRIRVGRLTRYPYDCLRALHL